MIKNLKVGTRVTFFPVDGAAYSAEGTIIKRSKVGGTFVFNVLVSEGTGSDDGRGKNWVCYAADIISAEPTPGAWTMGGLAPRAK